MRIMGGSETTSETAWPFIGSLNAECGAVLIGKHFALTAAHCCVDGDLKNRESTVVFGTSSLVDGSGHRAVIDSFRFHEDFNSESMHNDICVLHFAEEVPYGEKIQPACFASSAMHIFQNGYIAGWGKTSESGFQSTELLEAVVPIVGTLECNTTYKGLIHENQYCAGYRTGGVDACKGDSGGPLIQLDFNNRPRLAGIVSWGDGCGKAGKPSVYTKVQPYRSWIIESAEILSGKRACADPRDHIPSDPEVQYHCDALTNVCTVTCSNGATPNIPQVECESTVLARRGSGEEKWKVPGFRKPFSSGGLARGGRGIMSPGAVSRATKKAQKKAKKAFKSSERQNKKKKKNRGPTRPPMTTTTTTTTAHSPSFFGSSNSKTVESVVKCAVKVEQLTCGNPRDFYTAPNLDFECDDKKLETSCFVDCVNGDNPTSTQAKCFISGGQVRWSPSTLSCRKPAATSAPQSAMTACGDPRNNSAFSFSGPVQFDCTPKQCGFGCPSGCTAQFEGRKFKKVKCKAKKGRTKWNPKSGSFNCIC